MRSQVVDDPNTTRPVPDKLWRNVPEYFSRFTPRIHRDAQVCDDATIQCRIDIVGKGQPFIEAGNLCAGAGNLIALTMPDCIPDRLALAAYLIEAGFVYDGVQYAEMDGEAAGADTTLALDQSVYEMKLRNKQVLSKMAVQVIKFDKDLGNNVIEGWTTWKKGEEIILPKTTGKVYQDIDEYLPDRFDDIGWPMVLNLLHWGTGVVLDEATAAEVQHILQPIHNVVTLTNDFFSWEKEIAEFHKTNGDTPLINAVAFYMNWNSISAAEGKAAVKAKIEQLEEEYSNLKDAYIAQHGDTTPPAVLRWFSIMEAVVSGNLIWSNLTPRYHVSNLKAHEYEEYYARRVKEGALFFDSCTESDLFIPPVPQDDASEFRWFTPPSRGLGIREGSVESKLTAPESNLAEILAAPVSLEAPTNKRKRRGSVDVTTPPSETDLGSHLDTQQKQKQQKVAEDVKQQDDVIKINFAGGKTTTAVDYRQPCLPNLSEEVVKKPFHYIESLPSKGVRSHVLEALNSWYMVPEQKMKQIDSIVNSLHNASLMIDDIQDQTDLRRGKPATHMVFGVGQTINSAYFQCIEALNRAKSVSSDMFDIVMDEFRTGHVGQSLDLYWTFATVVPSEQEYLQMVDAKTSSLFRLCSRLLRSAATTNRHLGIEDMVTLFGRYFQIRDDYMNLSSQDYTDQKGFCSDLDEGKYSLPIIHAMREPDTELHNAMLERLQPGGISFKSKQWVLDRLTEKGAMEYTSKQIDLLYEAINDSLAGLEEKTGSINWILRRILEQLRN